MMDQSRTAGGEIARPVASLGGEIGGSLFCPSDDDDEEREAKSGGVAPNLLSTHSSPFFTSDGGARSRAAVVEMSFSSRETGKGNKKGKSS